MRALPSTPSNPQGVLKLLQGRGISVRVATKHLAAEEAPESYKAGAGLQMKGAAAVGAAVAV